MLLTFTVLDIAEVGGGHVHSAFCLVEVFHFVGIKSPRCLYLQNSLEVFD